MMELKDYTQEEQDQLKAISAAVESVRKLKVLAPKITDDQTYGRWISDDIVNLETTLSSIEIDMARVAGNRKINVFA